MRGVVGFSSFWNFFQKKSSETCVASVTLLDGLALVLFACRLGHVALVVHDTEDGGEIWRGNPHQEESESWRTASNQDREKACTGQA